MIKRSQKQPLAEPLLARPGWTAGGTLLMILAYYVVPLEADRSLWVRSVVLAAVLGILIVLTVRQLQRYSDPVGRLILVLVAVIMSLSVVCYLLATVPGQFEGLETRTDALYFTIVTMATVGYGDIHPIGQTSRAVMVLTVSFSMVFVATLASTIVSRLRESVGPDPDDSTDVDTGDAA